VFVAWLVHTSVDWMHLIPGLTGIALAAVAVLLAPSARRARADRRSLAFAAAVVLMTAIGSVGIVSQTVGHHLRVDARDSLTDDPEKALKRARQSLDWDGESVAGYYVEAAAYARFNDYRRARETLLEAARLEPHEHVTWGLLGDLAARRHDLAQAKRDYTRGSRLNPRERSLQVLARDPREALDDIEEAGTPPPAEQLTP
jgi:Flp pilus assembly protein TadD